MKQNFLNTLLASLILLLAVHTAMADRKTIKLATEEWPPFSYYDHDKKQISGLSTEIIQETFKRMKISIKENKSHSWIRTQTLVYEGAIDAAYTASISEERKKHCYFPTEPVITSQWVLFIKKENKERLTFNKFTDLKDKKLGLIKGYNYPADFNRYIRKNSLIDEVLLETVNIKKLIGGRFDYMPAVLETTLYLSKNHPDLKEREAYKKLHYFPTPLATTDFYLIFSKKTVTKDFVDKFSKALKEFKKTDAYQKILKKYL